MMHARMALVAAPVVMVYSTSNGAKKGNHQVRGSPMARKVPIINTVTMPTCAPEMAKIWTVPVAAKSRRRARGKSARYPISSDCTTPR